MGPAENRLSAPRRALAARPEDSSTPTAPLGQVSGSVDGPQEVDLGHVPVTVPNVDRVAATLVTEGAIPLTDACDPVVVVPSLGDAATDAEDALNPCSSRVPAYLQPLAHLGEL